MTRGWVRKVAARMLALIFYKPAATAVYAATFTMIGADGTRTALMGSSCSPCPSSLCLPC